MSRSEASGAAEVFEQFYYEVLLASFPPAELEPFPVMAAQLAEGRVQLRGMRDDAGQLLGGILGQYYPGTNCVLLTYLALAPGVRGGGYGSILLTEAVRHWGEQYRPCLVLGEFEHPEHHQASAEYGDPAARLRFYERAGARLLPVPYFQPSLAAGQPRVPALLLGVLHADPGLVRPAEAAATSWVAHTGGAVGEAKTAGVADALGTVAGAGIAAFLRQYFAEDLARHPDDTAFARLIAPLEATDRLPLLPMARLEEIPVGTLT